MVPLPLIAFMLQSMKAKIEVVGDYTGQTWWTMSE